MKSEKWTNGKLTAVGLQVLLLAGFIAVYFPVWKMLFGVWNTSEEYSHGFLVVPISIYVLWKKRDELKNTPIRPALSGGVVFLISLLIYLVGLFAEINTLAALSMIPLLSGAVIYLYGYALFRILFFPIAFLVFMIPIPSQLLAYLTVPLQLVVSKISVAFVSVFGLPIFREGNLIQLPDKTFQVVQACSGLRSLISLLMLCTFFGYFTLRGWISRSVLVIMAVPCAIFVNIVRVSMMILSHHYLDLDLTKESVHMYTGIGIFVIAILLIIGIRGVLARWER